MSDARDSHRLSPVLCPAPGEEGRQLRDADVRAAVRADLAARWAGDANTRIVEEMGVWSGSVRIDLAVINGQLCGVELKSDRDTLARLKAQAELYSRVFDFMTLVVGARHVEKAVERVPEWWGVTVAIPDGAGVALSVHRKARRNPDPDPYLVAQLLWREEALSILEARGLAKGWRSKSVRDIHQRLASELSFAALSEHVRTTLKRRNDWLGQPVRHV